MPLPSRLAYKSAELIENSDDELEMEPVDAINLPSQCVTIKSPPVADEPEVEKEHDNPDSRPGSPLPSTHNGRKKRKRTDTVQANGMTYSILCGIPSSQSLVRNHNPGPSAENHISTQASREARA